MVAPAIVRASNIMPVKSMLPEGLCYFDADAVRIAIENISNYKHIDIVRVDILFSKMFIRPEWAVFVEAKS